jgi:nucleoside-diphosphate-sugar epimerase
MFTIIGASGYIGSRLGRSLRAQGEEVAEIVRGDDGFLARELGNVIYCAGVTSDFLSRPLDTVEAHVAALLPLLREGRFASLLYLSSTRVYRGGASGREDALLSARPSRADDLYNLSKLMGEAACLASGRAGARVVRLSNVYGPGMARINFLADITAAALERGEVRLRTTLDSAKDYLSLEDALAILPRIAASGRERLYNLASGENVSNGAIAAALERETGCRVEVAADAARIAFPPIDIERVRREFGFAPARLTDRFPAFVAALREEYAPARPRRRHA